MPEGGLRVALSELSYCNACGRIAEPTPQFIPKPLGPEGFEGI